LGSGKSLTFHFADLAIGGPGGSRGQNTVNRNRLATNSFRWVESPNEQAGNFLGRYYLFDL
jgi:hypothetical protein